MEEELTYVAVTFKPNVVSDVKTNNNEEAVIYDELKTEEQTTCLLRQKRPSVISGKKAPVRSCLHLVAAGLGFVCIILILVIIVLGVQSHHLKRNILSVNTAMSEQLREKQNLTEVNYQLLKEISDLQRQTKNLSRERDDLNWTMGVIMEYDNFPVHTRCPNKVCKPCEDRWALFQSNCYFFGDGWKYWSESQELCRQAKANLVVIESQEEQEFINNRTATLTYYEGYGFWIGMKEETPDKWLWIDGSHPTLQYWVTQQVGSRGSCVRILQVRGRATALSNWNKANCYIGNHWICEKRALIKPE
uniref:C-type lectin domain-containing protein n=1 Tax=Sphaeramia orbicularis TaxID=375764 RepID=A0A673BI24_9TELE